MKDPKPVIVLRINPNEVEAQLTDLYICEGQIVEAGDVLATIESTKAALDISAEVSGFIKGLSKPIGAQVLAGDILCYIVEDLTQIIPEPSKELEKRHLDPGSAEKIRITKSARLLAETAGVDFSRFSTDRLITEVDIQNLIRPNLVAVSLISPKENSIILFGGGGHGKTLIELIRAAAQFEPIGIVDDQMQIGELVLGVPVICTASGLASLRKQGVRLGVNGVGGIGNLEARIMVFNLFNKNDFACPAVIHPAAICELSASIGEGAQVFALAYIGSEAIVGYGCIINTGAIISHDCQVGDYSNISPGAMLAGNVTVEEKVLIGMGATINLNVHVGAGARIGNGATIKGDVPPGTVVKAGSIWPS